MSRDWHIPGSLWEQGFQGALLSHQSLLMRAAPDAFCSEGDDFLLV